MKAKSVQKVSLMRGHILRFLEIANSIEQDDWESIIKAIQAEKDRVRRMHLSGELGNVYVMLFFLNEILQRVLESSEQGGF